MNCITVLSLKDWIGVFLLAIIIIAILIIIIYCGVLKLINKIKSLLKNDEQNLGDKT